MKNKVNKIMSLDSMRGIAAIFVVLYHISWQYSLRDMSIIRGGYLMVDFFFVLSGFVISLSYKDRILNVGELKSFILKRLFRLYPLHFFFLLVYFLYELLKFCIYIMKPSLLTGIPFTGSNTLSALAFNLLLIQGWGGVDYLSWNAPSWSISVEVFSYMTFSIIVLFFRKRLLLISTIISTACFIYIYINHNDLSFNINDGIFRCLMGFFFGVLTNHIYSKSVFYKGCIQKLSYGTISVFQVTTMFLFFTIIYFNKSIQHIDLLIIPLSALLLLLLPLSGALNDFLSLKFLTFLGDISYSIYLSHLIVLTLTYTFVKLFFKVETVNNIIQMNFVVGDLVTFLTLCVVIIVSFFTHKYIEVRYTNYLKKRFDI